MAHQGVPFRVRQRIDGKVDIQLRPIQVMWPGQLNAGDLPYRGLPEPRKVLERYEYFLLPNEEPKPVWRNTADLNWGSAFSKTDFICVLLTSFSVGRKS